MLHFASEAGSGTGTNLLQLPYARMDPVRSKFAIPAEEHVKVIGNPLNHEYIKFQYTAPPQH